MNKRYILILIAVLIFILSFIGIYLINSGSNMKSTNPEFDAEIINLILREINNNPELDISLLDVTTFQSRQLSISFKCNQYIDYFMEESFVTKMMKIFTCNKYKKPQNIN